MVEPPLRTSNEMTITIAVGIYAVLKLQIPKILIARHLKHPPQTSTFRLELNNCLTITPSPQECHQPSIPSIIREDSENRYRIIFFYKRQTSNEASVER